MWSMIFDHSESIMFLVVILHSNFSAPYSTYALGLVKSSLSTWIKNGTLKYIISRGRLKLKAWDVQAPILWTARPVLGFYNLLFAKSCGLRPRPSLGKSLSSLRISFEFNNLFECWASCNKVYDDHSRRWVLSIFIRDSWGLTETGNNLISMPITE